MVTEVFPAQVPFVGLSPVIVGAPVDKYWNWSCVTALEVPLFVVTRTSIIPIEPLGATASISESETKLKLVALVLPNLTAVAPVKPAPLITTFWPPAAAPVPGLTPAIVGTGP